MKFTMKKTLFLKTLMLSAATVALFGMTACSGSDDNIIGDEPITEQPAAVKTYQVSIPATMPSDEQTRAVSFDDTNITTTFKAGEKVYVYNVTTDEVMEGYLQPSNITTDGKGCDLTGTLTGTNAISANDKLKLMYNLNHYYQSDPTCCGFYYSEKQDGTQSGVVDGALATVNVSSYTGDVLTTKAAASFQPVQSMFRFQFVDKNNNLITVKKLDIESTGSDIAATYWPFDNNPFNATRIMVTPSSPTSDYIYVAICIRENQTPTALEFTVKDNDGNEYKGTRSAPSGGFKNGKYYYNTQPITLTKQTTAIAPTITWTSVKYGNAVSPDADNRYLVYGPNNGASEITISGTSSGYYFSMNGGGTIHLSNLTATYDGDFDFIYSTIDLNLDISGANSITCKNNTQTIGTDNGTLKLSGNGTLTVTADNKTRCGLYGFSNYKESNNLYSTTTEVDVTSLLAAPGYTVTRSARTDNADGTYTWTYTVAPRMLSSATTADYGMVVCAAGHLHPAKTAVPAGCTAVGILGKVTETGHGLILALQNATMQTWNTINGWTSQTYASTTLKVLPDDNARGSNLTSYTTLGTTTVSNWAVAQKSDYDAIFQNLGSETHDGNGYTFDNNVNEYITTGVGGSAISGYYWSATGGSQDNAWIFISSYWASNYITKENYVRPVLGF